MLSVFDNNMLGTVPSSIGNLVNLEELIIGNNAFYGELPTELAQCTQFKTLMIGNNAFKGEYANLYKKFPNLITFEFEISNSKGSIATLDTED